MIMLLRIVQCSPFLPVIKYLNSHFKIVIKVRVEIRIPVVCKLRLQLFFLRNKEMNEVKGLRDFWLTSQ